MARKKAEIVVEGKWSGKKLEQGVKHSTKQMQDAFVGVKAKIALATAAIGILGVKLVKVAGQVQGVENAFQAIGDEKLLQGLRDATRDTVTDLELMKQAVRASNFKIPLEKLGTLFEFARRRAKETGEEVGFLVDSIIAGLGRKSPLILDNLGLSLTEIQKEVKKSGDFFTGVSNVIENEMGNMVEDIDTVGERWEQMTAKVGNLQEAMSVGLAPAFDVMIEKANTLLDKLIKGANAAANIGLNLLDPTDVLEATKAVVQLSLQKEGQELLERSNLFGGLLISLVGSGASSDFRKRFAEILKQQEAAQKKLTTKPKVDPKKPGGKGSPFAAFEELTRPEFSGAAAFESTIEGFDVLTESVRENAGILREEVEGVGETWQTILHDQIPSNAQFAASVMNSFAGTVASGFESIGQSLVTGQNLFDSFGKVIGGFIGDIAISLGRLWILTGIASNAVPLLGLSGGAAIAAGSALTVFGGAVKAGVASIGGSGGGGGRPQTSSRFQPSSGPVRQDSGPTVNVFIQGGVIGNEKEVGDFIGKRIQKQLKRQRLAF